MRKLAESAQASRLLLVTRHRGPGRVPMADGSADAGILEGLGFHVDRSARLRNLRRGDVSTGFVAPFASLRFTLVGS